MTAAPQVIVVATPTVSEVRTMLRTLAERGRATGAARTWAVLGRLIVDEALSENEGAVEHDLIGRQAVRLAVDKTLCVGDSRAVRALHQGAIMEGSWGDEARLTATADEARVVLTADDDWVPGAGDVILVAADDPQVAALARLWPDADPIERDGARA